MKKILWGLIFFLILIFASRPAAAASAINLTFDPQTAKVGDKVNVYFDVVEAPTGSDKVSLYISDVFVGQPKGNEAHLKGTWDAPDVNASAGYRYIWDTEAALSNPGLHYVNVFVLDPDNYVKLNKTETYTLAEASSPSPTPTGATPTPTPTYTATSSTGIGSFGTIIFPSTKISSIRDLIVAIIDWLLVLAGALAVIAVIYSGIMYITAGGDPAKAETAKKNLIWAIIGVIVIALALVIINTVVDVLQGNVPSPSSPTPTVSASATVIPSPSVSPSPVPSPS